MLMLTIHRSRNIIDLDGEPQKYKRRKYHRIRPEWQVHRDLYPLIENKGLTCLCHVSQSCILSANSALDFVEVEGEPAAGKRY